MFIIQMTPTSRVIPWLLAAASTVLMIGCAEAPKSPFTTIGQLPAVEKIQDKLAALKLTIPKPGTNIDAPRFVNCMAPLTSRLEPGLIDFLSAVKANTDNVLADIDKLNGLEDHKLFSDHPLISDLLFRLTAAPQLGAPTNIADKIKADLAARREQFKQRFTDEKHLLTADTKQAAELGKTYLTAYFKKGGAQLTSQFIQDPTEQTELKQQAASLLKLKADDPRLDKVLELVNKQLAKSSGKLAQKSAGLVGRDGTQYGFPGIVEADTHADIDHSQIAADTLRILLEAIRDHYAPLPVLPQSTAAATLTNYVIEFGKPLRWTFDKRDPGNFETVTIDEAGFQSIEAHARKAEASVAGAVGKAIRGGSWGSLNNEAVAKLVETAAGVVARHMTERAEWCLQAQTGEAHANTPQ